MSDKLYKIRLVGGKKFWNGRKFVRSGKNYSSQARAVHACEDVVTHCINKSQSVRVIEFTVTETGSTGPITKKVKANENRVPAGPGPTAPVRGLPICTDMPGCDSSGSSGTAA